MTRLKNTALFAMTALSIVMGTTASADIVVGGSILNGDFNADTGLTEARSFADTPNWENIGTGDQSAQATRLSLPNTDGSRNAVLSHASGRVFGLNTG